MKRTHQLSSRHKKPSMKATRFFAMMFCRVFLRRTPLKRAHPASSRHKKPSMKTTRFLARMLSVSLRDAKGIQE